MKRPLLSISQRILRPARAPHRFFAHSSREKRLETVYKDILSGPFLEQHPGLAITVVSLDAHGGPAYWRRFQGFSNVESKKPIEGTTVFRIGSVSKTITALLIMNLVESGKIPSIDEPIINLLSLANAALLRGRYANAVTVRHLLSHTSGCSGLYQWKDIVSSHANLGWPKQSAEPEPTFSQYYSSRGGFHFNRPPGEEYVYSNHAFAILGQIIEDVSEESLEDYARRVLFKPLSMNSTSFHRTEGEIASNLSTGYVARTGINTTSVTPFEPVDDFEIIVKAAGSIYTSINDMEKYLAFLLSSSPNGIISQKSKDLLWTPQFQLHPKLAFVGLGFKADTHVSAHANSKPTKKASHTGGWPGFSTNMVILPEIRTGFAIFSNAMSRSLEKIESRITHALLGSALQSDNPSASTCVEQASAEQLSRFVGWYRLSSRDALTHIQHIFAFGPLLRIRLVPTATHLDRPQLVISGLWGQEFKCDTCIMEEDGSIVAYLQMKSWDGPVTMPRRIALLPAAHTKKKRLAFDTFVYSSIIH